MADVDSLLDLLLQDESDGAEPTEADSAGVEEISEADKAETEETEEPSESDGEDSGLSLGEMFSLLGTYQEVVSEIKNDDRAQLIKAIKPFLSEARQTKADNCLKFLSITRFMEHKEEFSKVGGKILPV